MHIPYTRKPDFEKLKMNFRQFYTEHFLVLTQAAEKPFDI